MPFYETTFIARPDLSSQQAEGLAERFAGLVTENGGAVAKTEHWGLRSLAYHIKKHRKGHYVMFGLDAPSATVKELERSMRIDEDVLRFLTVRVDMIDPEPSAPIHSRGGREDRPRGERGGREARDERGEAPGQESAAKSPEEEGAKSSEEKGTKSSEEKAAKTEVKGEARGDKVDLEESKT